MLADFAGRRVLLLQGPNGPLFRRIGQALRDVGAEVSKINLNPADALFYPGPHALPFRGTLEEWPEFLRAQLLGEGAALVSTERLKQPPAIEVVFLFGDCRPYHRVARAVCAELDIEVFVVEEGYLRPDYITIERGGVNKHSTMPRDPAAYSDAPKEVPRPQQVKSAFAWSVWFTILNSLAITLFGFRYPHYKHHRDVNTWRQMWLWAFGFLRRAYYLPQERPLLARVKGDWSRGYFLVGLQVHNDSQVQHSPFADVGDFIREVVASFAEHAPPDCRLLVKHHPADRAYRDYGKLLWQLAREHGLGDRLVYLHDLHLPTLLSHARGVVVINSTVGLSALYHHAPVKALGEAVYRWMGLTSEQPLADFWQAPPEVERARYQQARRWLIHHNQANGSVWCKLAHTDASGLVWPVALAPRPRLAEVTPDLGAPDGRLDTKRVGLA